MNFKFTIAILVVFVVFDIGSIPDRAFADQVDLSLYPPITTIAITPGNVAKTGFTLVNHGEITQTVTVQFLPLPEVITALFILEKNGERIGDEFLLRPSETATISLTIDTTKEASDSALFGKDYYFTLLFQTQNPSRPKQTSSKVEAAIGSNILLSLYQPTDYAGEKTKARIQDFRASYFSFGEPIGFVLRVANEGEHVFLAHATIVITDIDGKEIETISLPKQYVLAHTTANLTAQTPPLSPDKLFGKYDAVATLLIEGREPLTQNLRFYAIPKKITLMTLAGILIILILFHRIRAYRRSTRFSRRNKPK